MKGQGVGASNCETTWLCGLLEEQRRILKPDTYEKVSTDYKRNMVAGVKTLGKQW